MQTHRSCLLVGALSLLTVHSGFATEKKPESLEFSLLHDGVVVQIDPDVNAQLAVKTAAYFDTCHTHLSVVGNEPDEGSVRQLWEDVTDGTHALLRLPRGDDRADLLVGFSSAAGAWPVILRQNDHYVSYLKCDGLEGSLLACDMSELLPHSAVPPDCDRLRDIERQESTDDESTMSEGAA